VIIIYVFIIVTIISISLDIPYVIFLLPLSNYHWYNKSF